MQFSKYMEVPKSVAEEIAEKTVGKRSNASA